MTSAFSWQNFVSLCPASFCTLKPNLPVTLGISTSYFCVPVPCDEEDIFYLFIFWCQVQKFLQAFIEPFNFSLFGISGWGRDLDYCDTEWFTLEVNRDHSVIFEIAPKPCISDSSIDYMGYSISSKGFLPTVVDIFCAILCY